MEAKEFLASRIAGEAKRRHMALSEVEQKMLYFSEGYPTLPDMMEVNAEFEAKYDDEKYEKKIRKLSRKAFAREREESPENVHLWREAIKLLEGEDHYLLVMLDVPRSAGDRVRLLIAGLVVVAILVGTVWLAEWAHRHIRIPDWLSLLFIILVFIVAYFLTFSPKAKWLGNRLADMLDQVARWF
jgi:hypothetical protein